METRGALIVRFTLRAENDLAAILDYLTALSPEGARRVAASLEETIRTIAQHPFGARRTSRPMLSVKIVRRYPYKIFYRIREDTIEIVHTGTPHDVPGSIAAASGCAIANRGAMKKAARLMARGSISEPCFSRLTQPPSGQARGEMRDRSDRAPLPWPTPSRSLSRTSPSSPRSRRLPQAP
jgi:toxin ParE1/3/4